MTGFSELAGGRIEGITGKMATRPNNTRKKRQAARTQLTLVEHALCPLIPPDGPFTHRAEYYYFKNRNRKRAQATIVCPEGLKPEDEYYLNSLLGLIFAASEPNLNFYASASYLLNALGIQKVGGKSVRLLRDSIHRLGKVRYENSGFYDPVRKEHRDIGFGFLSYDLPKANESARPWHIAIDPIYFKFCQSNGGFLSFNRELYRRLRPASRRLYLLTNKLLYRNQTSGYFDVEHLCVNQLGFAVGMRPADYNKKLMKCVSDLAAESILGLPGSLSELCVKVSKGKYRVRFTRGPGFRNQAAPENDNADSSVIGLLQSIKGLNAGCIGRIAKECHRDQVYQWVDATIMAREKYGSTYFKKNEAAFFYEGVTSTRRPPDWYFQARRQAEQQESEHLRSQLDRLGLATNESNAGKSTEVAFNEWIGGEGKARLERHIETMGDRRKAVSFLRRWFEFEMTKHGLWSSK